MRGTGGLPLNEPAQFRLRVRIATVVLAAVPVATHATDDIGLENITVTGSRIARADFESASPVATVGREAFLQTSAASVERTLNTLPQFAASATSTSNDPGNDGQANVSLRGLGVAQTLVLLDGRRLLPADGVGSVDLNALPPALIDRVEVVTGGASAVYGSDAIAGVVNFKLKQRFQGLQFDGQWSQTGQGDGRESSAGLTAGTGFAGGRGSVMAYVGYTDRSQVNQDDRRFSRYPLQYFADVVDGRGPGHKFLAVGNTVGEQGVAVVFGSPSAFRDLFASYGYAPGSVPYQAGFGLNEDGTLFTIGNTAPGSVANYRGPRDPVLYNDRVYSYDAAPFTALQLPLERSTAFLRATYEFSPAAEIYLQSLYADYSATRQLSSTITNIALIPPTNPYVSADLRAMLDSRVNPALPFRFLKSVTELGPRIAQNDRELLQTTLGLRGGVFERWHYDAYVQSGTNDRTEYQQGNVRISRFEDLTFAPDGGLALCGGFNPFGRGDMSRDCARYISTDATNRIEVKQTLAEAALDGPALSLNAGDLRIALGAFYKKDEFDYVADPALGVFLPAVPGVIGPRPDIAGFPAGASRHGQESNTDLYVEALVPVLKDVPGVRALELGLGYRYSEYRRAGGANSYKGELLYRPVQAVRLRGSYQHAVRAPSIDELFFPRLAGQFEINPTETDPCNRDSTQRKGPDKAQVEALCLAQGLPAALLPTFEYPLRRVDGVSGGNPDLKPEQADTLTLGVVFDSPFDAPVLRTLQVSVDWYRIRLDDGIGRWDTRSAVERCFDPRYNPGYDAHNVYCSFFTRKAVSGEIFALQINRNIGGVDTSGVDAHVAWTPDLGPGRLAVDGYATYVDQWQYVDPGGGTIAYAGTIGGTGLGHTLPRWKSLLHLGYLWNGIDFFTRWQHIAGMRDVRVRDFEVPSYDTVALGASYQFGTGTLHGLAARVGVDNVFDQEPPIFPSWQQANTDPTQYDVLGRRWYFGLSYKF